MQTQSHRQVIRMNGLTPSRLLALLASLLLPALALADPADDRKALAGVESGKIAWDINMGDPAKLALYLEVMEQTYEDLVRQGVAPDMVFTFRGPSLPLVSSERTDVPMDIEVHHDAIADRIKALLARPNVRMEACGVAARLFSIDGGTLLPGVELVGNTFVSQIGYQARGYATIPIF